MLSKSVVSLYVMARKKTLKIHWSELEIYKYAVSSSMIIMEQDSVYLP